MGCLNQNHNMNILHLCRNSVLFYNQFEFQYTVCHKQNMFQFREELAHLLCIYEVSVSDFGLEAGYPATVCHGFPQACAWLLPKV